jgi:hypothetical protein
MADLDGLLVEQLSFYWDAHLRPRLEGLTDAEYFWEPVDGCWSLRRGEHGRYLMERRWPEPEPQPVTTIAWRMMHVAVDCFASRTSAFFGDGTVPEDADMFDPGHFTADLPGSAAAAVDFLEGTYQRWRDRIAALHKSELIAPLGPKAGRYAEEPMAGLILHINREVMHHGGEICLLRDLYRAVAGTGRAGLRSS